MRLKAGVVHRGMDDIAYAAAEAEVFPLEEEAPEEEGDEALETEEDSTGFSDDSPMDFFTETSEALISLVRSSFAGSTSSGSAL